MNPMFILQAMFGNEKAQEMMNKWQSMTPQQRQEELNKVNNMSDKEKDDYLKQKGSSLSALKGNNPQQNNGGNRFNY